MTTQIKQSIFSPRDFSAGNREFYDIPLLGEVQVEMNTSTGGDYNIGELIKNFTKNDTRSLTLRAIDDGLASTGILTGDFLTVNIKAKLQNGDIAAIKLGDKIYIRKIYFENNFVRLETEGHSPSPFIIDIKTPGFEIIGKVITVIREL
jgi:SOS-response transcriptional repressor LexA